MQVIHISQNCWLGNLSSDMANNSYSYAGEIDMEKTIDNALNLEVNANSFAHFWLDGWIGDPDNIKRIQIIRRLVLIAAGRVLRKEATADTEAIWEEFKNMSVLHVGEQEFRNTLQDFVRRKVLVENQCGDISPKIPLFQSWLTDKGVRELLGTLRDLKHVRSILQDEEQVRVTDKEVMELEEQLDEFRFRGRAIEAIAIRRWLDQFDSAGDQRLMFGLLSRVSTYSEDAVRAKMKEALGIVTRNIRTTIKPGMRVRHDILVSSLDDSAAKSGLTYCRLFADENGIAARSVQTLDRLRRRFPGNSRIQRLVFIDDFSGTGQTLERGLKRNLDFLQCANSKGVQIIVIAVAGFAQARDRIERFIQQSGLEAKVHFCDTFGPEHQVFSEGSAIFPRSDRTRKC